MPAARPSRETRRCLPPFPEWTLIWKTRHFGLFQHQLVASLYQILLPGLVDRYRAASIANVRDRGTLFTSIIRKNGTRSYIEIRQRTDGRLITLVDVPRRSTRRCRKAVPRTWKLGDWPQSGASIVEIDLSLQGKPLLEYSRDGLPEWDFAVTVTRCTQPERYEIYTSTLAKRLPRFKVPLAADDRDTVLDLQATFARAYDQSNFANKIDYRQDPATKMSNPQVAWIADWLKQMRFDDGTSGAD